MSDETKQMTNPPDQERQSPIEWARSLRKNGLEHTMTTPTHDPEIEQEAARMLSELEKLCVRGRGPLYSSGSTVEILRSDMFGLLRELATLRRGAAKPVDDAELRAIEERAAKASPGPWLHKIYDVHGDNHHAIEIEDGSELAQVWGDDNDPQCWPVSANADFIAHSREDIDTLLTALRSRGGEGEGTV